MTKRVKSVAVVVLAVVAIFTIAGIVGHIETHYTRDARVIEIESDSTVVVEDGTGNVWAFVEDGFVVGDKVRMEMFTNGTDSNITDDEILNVKLR